MCSCSKLLSTFFKIFSTACDMLERRAGDKQRRDMQYWSRKGSSTVHVLQLLHRDDRRPYVNTKNIIEKSWKSPYDCILDMNFTSFHGVVKIAVLQCPDFGTFSYNVTRQFRILIVRSNKPQPYKWMALESFRGNKAFWRRQYFFDLFPEV